MNLLDLLQLTKGQPVQQAENSIGPIMQFLAQHRSQPMPLLQMPNMPDHSGMIMQAGLQKQARQDLYAAHLQAKAQMEAQQAAAIAGHEAELSDDPQVQAMLRSGNPQLVAYAMKIAEDEKQKKIASQYNENATFAKYLDALQTDPAKAAQMMAWKKAGATNINMGDKTANDIVWMTPEQKVAAGLDPGQPYAINQKSGMPEAIKPNEFTDAQNVATGYYNRMLAAEEVLDSEMAAGFETGSPKEAIANALPYGLGGLLRTPQMQRVRQAQEDWVRAKLRKESGAAIPPDEMDREIQTYFPGLNETDPSVIEQKRRSRQKAVEQLYEATGGKQSAGTNPYVAKAAERLGLPIDHPVVQLAQQGIVPQESGGNEKIHDSVDGAKGLMQVMPSTFNQVLPGGNINDPYDNATAGLAYLLDNWTKTGGNLTATAMNYHGGPKAYQRPNIKDGLGVSNQQYAKSVLANIRKNSPVNKDKKAELQKRAAALGW